MKSANSALLTVPALRFFVLVVFIAVQLVPGSSVAQEGPPALEFSFSNPGARSMGVGGAFVALADDATAAFANPAGLVQLSRPEISLELRRRDYSSPYTEGGRAVGAPTGFGIDTVDGVRTGFSNETTSGVSYLSFVYPGAKWSLALYRHQLADFVFRTKVNGLFGDVPNGVRRYDDQRAVIELDVVGTGFAAAYQVTDGLSLGLGVSYFTGTVENLAGVYLIDSYPEDDSFYESNSFLPNQLDTTSSFSSDTSDVGFNFGVLWEFAESWRLGGVYRQGPQFGYELYNRAGPANELPEGTILASVTDRSIAFPDVWGLGVAYRSPSGGLTVGFEWDWVEYSVVLETLASDLVDPTDVSVDDANELHLGLEYVFLKTTPLIAVRGGVWHDPGHRFHYSGDNPFTRALYPAGEDALHIAVGVGVAFKRVQVDIGADFSDGIDQFSVSGIFSF
jgi:long-subunit fatty acid transport protein